MLARPTFVTVFKIVVAVAELRDDDENTAELTEVAEEEVERAVDVDDILQISSKPNLLSKVICTSYME